MNINNINYPYPVLDISNSDYINCSFNIIVDGDVEIIGDKAKIHVNYTLVSNGLKELIMGKKAKAIVYVESPTAGYRKVFTFQNNEQDIDITIKKSTANKKITVKGYIIANENVKSFTLEEHNHEIFGKIPFELMVGDIIAVAEDSYTIPLNSFDPLSDRPSIFSIRIGHTQKEEVYIDYLSNDKISIILNEENYKNYCNLYKAPDVRTILTTLYVIPALVDVLAYIKTISADDKEDAENKRWYQVLTSRIKELNIDLSNEPSLTKIANLIIPEIYGTSLESLKDLCENLLISEGENNED